MDGNYLLFSNDYGTVKLAVDTEGIKSIEDIMKMPAMVKFIDKVGSKNELKMSFYTGNINDNKRCAHCVIIPITVIITMTICGI